MLYQTALNIVLKVHL